MTITKKICPNKSIGRGGKKIEYIIIHWFGIGTLTSANNRFQTVGANSSAHYGISDDKVWQWVEEKDTAWHAGNFDINQRSIGIEHDATTTKNASELTYKTSSLLIREISQRYGIPLDREHIKGHNEISATQCPGTIDIDKLIKMAQNDDMTEQEKNLLKIIKEAGLNEGDIRWLADNISLKKNDTVKKLEKELSSYKLVNNELADKVSIQGEEIEGLKRIISEQENKKTIELIRIIIKRIIGSLKS